MTAPLKRKNIIRYIYIIKDLKFSSDDYNESDEKQIMVHFLSKVSLCPQNIGHFSLKWEVK